jgi:hypothetical protein
MGNCSTLPNHQIYNLQIANDWNVSLDDLNTAESSSDNILEMFCIAKNITETRFQNLYFSVSEELLKKTGKGLENPPRWKFFSYRKWWLTGSHEIAKLAQETLIQLLQASTFSSSIIPQEMSFDYFVNLNPEWSENENNFVFFRDHKAVKFKNVLIQRKQLSGNCYIHGPIVAHYYIMCMRYDNTKPVDIRTYILRHLDTNHLSKLITHCGGGNSRTIYQNLIGSQAMLIITGFNSYQNEIKKHLELYGPGLVTGFQIEKQFQRDQSKHYGKLMGEIIGSHSMVLVGVRQDEMGNQYVLLQNWWKHKQFVECDAEYFSSSGATIYFCKGDIGIHSFNTSSAIYDEGNYDNDDKWLEDEDL